MADVNGFDKAMGSVGSALSVANAGAGLLDSIFGFSAKRQYKYQKQLMNDQYGYWLKQQDILANQQLEQWNRENEYNDPTNYYKRLMDGAEANGLSKAAIMGNSPGGSVGQSASGVSVPGTTAMPSAGSSSLLPIGSANTLANLRQHAEIANIEAQTANLEQQTQESSSRVALNDVNSAYLSALEWLTNEKATSEEYKREGFKLSNALKQLEVENYQDITDANLRKLFAETNNINLSSAEKTIGLETLSQRNEAILEQTRSITMLNIADVALKKVLEKKYGAEYVRQLAENEHFNRIKDDLAKEISNNSYFSSFGDGIVGSLVGSVAGPVHSILSSISDVLGFSDNGFYNTPIGSIFVKLSKAAIK